MATGKRVVISKTDLTDYAIKLGVWDALVEGIPGGDPVDGVESVEVMALGEA